MFGNKCSGGHDATCTLTSWKIQCSRSHGNRKSRLGLYIEDELYMLRSGITVQILEYNTFRLDCTCIKNTDQKTYQRQYLNFLCKLLALAYLPKTLRMLQRLHLLLLVQPWWSDECSGQGRNSVGTVERLFNTHKSPTRQLNFNALVIHRCNVKCHWLASLKLVAQRCNVELSPRNLIWFVHDHSKGQQ